MRKRSQFKLSIAFAFSLAFSGCMVPNTLLPNKAKCLCKSCEEKTTTTPKEFITIQGPEVPTKAMLLGQQGLSLSEAIFEWQRATMPASASTFFNRTNIGDRENVGSVQVNDIELSLGVLPTLRPAEVQINVSLRDSDRLSGIMSKVLDSNDYIANVSEASIGLLSYLELAKGGNHEKLRTSIESLGSIPEVESLKTAALEAIKTQNWNALSQAINSIRNSPLPAVKITDLFTLVSKNKLKTADEYSLFVKMPNVRAQFDSSFTETGDRGQIKVVFDYLSGFDKNESPEKAAALDALKSLIREKKIANEWSARGLAFEAVRDPKTWANVDELFRKKLGTTTNQIREQARQTSMRAPIYETVGSLQPFLDERAVILRKSDGSQSVMPMSAVFASPIGGIRLEDGDSISLFRWEQLPLGATAERHDITELLSNTVGSRVNWHNVAVVDTSFMGRATQVYFPLDDLHSSSLPSASIIPADASFSYANFAALPIMMRSQAIMERRLRGEQVIDAAKICADNPAVKQMKSSLPVAWTRSAMRSIGGLIPR